MKVGPTAWIIWGGHVHGLESFPKRGGGEGTRGGARYSSGEKMVRVSKIPGTDGGSPMS